MSQYLSDGRSDWYSTAQLGLAFFDLVEEDVDVLTGFGFAAGMGRQWRGHVGMELLIGWESTDRDIDGASFGNSTITMRMQVVAMAY